MKKVITKSRSGHYTACLQNDHRWNLYKAIKLASSAKANWLLDEAKAAILDGTYKNNSIQGDFSIIRVENYLNQKNHQVDCNASE